jgi:hypothetical protein
VCVVCGWVCVCACVCVWSSALLIGVAAKTSEIMVGNGRLVEF